jgi:hypothetical protein
MKAWARHVLIACGCASSAMLVLFILAHPYAWLRLGRAVVSLDGQRSDDVPVYRSYYGDLLVWVPEPPGLSPYIIRCSERCVGCPNLSYFYRTRLFSLSREKHAIGVLLNSPKIEVDPRLVLQPGYVEFTTMSLRRVCVRL